MSELPQKFEKIPETSEEELRQFRETIGRIAAEQQKERKLAHFLDIEFNPDDLNEDDMRIWRAVEDGTITAERFGAYRKGFDSRLAFLSYIANRAAAVLGRRQLEEEMEQRKQKS